MILSSIQRPSLQDYRIEQRVGVAHSSSGSAKCLLCRAIGEPSEGRDNCSCQAGQESIMIGGLRGKREQTVEQSSQRDQRCVSVPPLFLLPLSNVFNSSVEHPK